VFVDLGQGRFRPQEVHVGAEANGMFEVLDGLSVGDVVAVSGVFLIAAEARISTAAKYWDATSPVDAGIGAMAPTASPPPPTLLTPQIARSAMPLSHLPAPAAAPSAASPSAVFTCPMHPAVQHAGPGKCPICGMDLVPMSGGTTP
jgi:hypothetical protein